MSAIPEGPRKKTTEITDLPDPALGDEQAGDVKGGATIIPCVKTIVPCVKTYIPCIKTTPIRGT
jgi:hypothetical protein